MLGLGKIIEVVTILLGHEFVRNGLDRLGKITVERVEKLVRIEPRQVFLETMRLFEEEDPAKAQILWDRVEAAHRRGVENIVVNALGNSVPLDERSNPDLKSGVRVYAWLADMPPLKFEQAMDRLKHDPIAQAFRYWVGKRGLSGLQYAAGFLIEQVDHTAGGAARQVNEFADRLETISDRVKARALRKLRRR